MGFLGTNSNGCQCLQRRSPCNTMNLHSGLPSAICISRHRSLCMASGTNEWM